tara:strand:+ start:459 stop:2549 length:2091 start_codon:yes stop_codon:yes gene_type:complete
MAELPFLPMRTVPLGSFSGAGGGAKDKSAGDESLETDHLLGEDSLGLGLRHRAASRAPAKTGGAPCPVEARNAQAWGNATHICLGPAVFMLVTLGTYVCVGLAALVNKPIATDAIGSVEIPSLSHCLRVYRTADYVTASVNMGTPYAMLEVLVRFDLVDPLTRQSGLRLFSSRVAESHSVSCDGVLCTDAAVMQLAGPNGPAEVVAMNFEYTNPTQEAITYSAASELGLDGELYMSKGFDYYLTATHLCYSPLETLPSVLSSESLAAEADEDGLLRASGSAVAKFEPLGESPVAEAEQNAWCGSLTSVALFPGDASQESAWLGLGSSRLYEFAGSGIKARRTVVEVGSACAAAHAGYERAYSLFQLDCQAYNVACETYPTVPFRRLAKSQLRISVDGKGHALVWAVDDIRLHELPKFSESSDSIWMAVLKLGVMVLTAGIVWIRSARTSSSVEWLYTHSIRVAFGIDHPELEGDDMITDDYSTLEDAAIGLVAIAARQGIAQWRLVGLEPDGQIRACSSEIAASLVSFVHWFMRNFLLERGNEPPLTKLGGSTAVVDASCAVLLAFSEPPLLVTSFGRFDPTARLLTALLITLTTLQRCIFASASCGIRWAVAKDNPRCSESYRVVIFVSGWIWIAQAASVAVLLCDVFVTPSAFSLMRASTSNVRTLSAVLFLTVTVAGMPQLLRVSRRILNSKI